MVALGIDTGGTYTDAVLVDHTSGEVLAVANALTTRHDLNVPVGAGWGQQVYLGTELTFIAVGRPSPAQRE